MNSFFITSFIPPPFGLGFCLPPANPSGLRTFDAAKILKIRIRNHPCTEKKERKQRMQSRLSAFMTSVQTSQTGTALFLPSHE